MRSKIRKTGAFITLLLLCVFFMQLLAYATVTLISPATETEAEIQAVETTNGDSYVRYPQLAGMHNTAHQQQINDSIVTEANIAQRLITMSAVTQGATGLQVGYTAYLHNQILSVVISAKGIMENFRSGQQYTTLCYDLETGNRLTISDFFTDPEAAVAWMETQISGGYVDDLSTYLENAELTPIPTDRFSVDEYGITFYYPYNQFALLSGYSGSVQFQYGELQEFLIRATSSVPFRVGAVLPAYTDTQIREAIEAAVAQGTLPYLPVHLGDAIPDLITANRLVRTPDQYPGGRYFQLEAPVFRDVWILSDSLSGSYDLSVVHGILATRMNLYGLQTGHATRDRWQSVLGSPTTSVVYDSAIAADYGLPVGTADYYTISDRQLMLYADANDMLYAVRLSD